MKHLGVSVVVFPEGKSYSSWCPELDVASQGDSVDEAIANLREAIDLHIECLSTEEKKELTQKKGNRIVTTLDIALPF